MTECHECLGRSCGSVGMSKCEEQMNNDENRCTCISCPECGGSGCELVRTSGYPEEDIEACSTCRGSGISEKCEYCIDHDEQDDDDY